MQTSNFLTFNSVFLPIPPPPSAQSMTSKPSATIFLVLLCLLTLYGPSLRSLRSLFIAARVSSAWQACTSPPCSSQHCRCRRCRSDRPGFIYVFQVIDGTGRMLFKIGCTNNLTQRRREWHQKCAPIQHSWCRRRFPTLLAYEHGM